MLRTDLGLSSSNIAWLVSVFYLGAIILMLPSGIASDRIGPRWLFLLGGVIIFAALWVASSSNVYGVLLVCMFLAGFGNAANLPATTRAIMDWFTASGGRATAMSVKQTGVALAGVISAITIPLVVGPLGWRGTLFAVGLIAFVACAICALVYPRGVNPEAGGSRSKVPKRDLPPQPREVRVQLAAIAAYTISMAGVQLSFQSFFSCSSCASRCTTR